MRVAFSLLMLFAVAVASALLAGDNPGTVTLFWPPYRVDLSLNLALVTTAVVFVTVHLAIRALTALFAMPQLAKGWRAQQRERAVFDSLVDALLHLSAGRFIRARNAAERALKQEELLNVAGAKLPYGGRLRSMAHLLAAEGAHALLDKDGRTLHLEKALRVHGQRDAAQAREGVQLRAAGWALDDLDAPVALKWLDEMPQGAARRTAALRLRLKASRIAGHTAAALDTARLLAKHRAFSNVAATGILRGLALELIDTAREPDQLQKIWLDLERKDHAASDVAAYAAKKLLQLGGDPLLARQWLLPLWEKMVEPHHGVEPDLWLGVVEAIELSLNEKSDQAIDQDRAGPTQVVGLDAAWLTRIESAQMRNPGNAMLQYLAGITCKHLKLWGKAQQLLTQSLPKIRGSRLERSAWVALASLAEQRGDTQAAMTSWRNAAKANLN